MSFSSLPSSATSAEDLYKLSWEECELFSRFLANAAQRQLLPLKRIFQGRDTRRARTTSPRA